MGRWGDIAGRVRSALAAAATVLLCASSAAALNININPGATLAGNTAALDAFNRAAD